jgi:hypothetical protein
LLSAVIALAALAVPGSAFAATPAASPNTTKCAKVVELSYSSAQDAAARRYWTPQRMKAAPGFSQAMLAKSARYIKANAGTARALISAGTTTKCLPLGDMPLSAPSRAGTAKPLSTSFGGYSSVGKFFGNFGIPNGAAQGTCTASVINGAVGPNQSLLIMTAAHCITGVYSGFPYAVMNMSFAPKWNNGNLPYGSWQVQHAWVSANWLNCPFPVTNCQTDPQYDYGIIVLKPLNGNSIANVTGMNGFNTDQPVNANNVTIIGYPSSANEPLINVTNTTTVTESGEFFRTGSTPGFTTGCSGSPWFSSFNASQQVGTLLGEIGGYEEGGPSSGTPSYSPVWTLNGFGALVGFADYNS